MTENLVVCSKCSTINRLPPSRPAIDAKCGKCKAKVFAGHPEDVAAEIFDRQIARSTIPVLVDVWAPWCGPCRMMAPAYEAAAGELEPQVRLIKLNSDAEQGVASRLGIQGIPTACANLDAARQMAKDIVSELREDPELGGCQVLIIDEAGNEVLRLGTDTLH